MTDLKPGMEIYLEPIGNAARRSSELIDTKIEKVGRKYFTTQSGNYGKFFIETLLQDGRGYSANYKAWLSKDDFLKNKEYMSLKEQIRSEFTQWRFPKLSMEDCYEILAIINKNK